MDELRGAQVELTLAQSYQARGGGGEHLIFRAEPHDGRIYKATWHEQFGWVPKLNRAGQLRLCPATPSEYLLRCGLANVVFGDDIRLLCIAQDQAGNSEVPAIVTSQPFVIGVPPESEEIHAHLRALDFLPLPKAQHRPSGLHDVWYRQADQMLVCDAVAGNFVRSAAGQLFAIDLPAALMAGLVNP